MLSYGEMIAKIGPVYPVIFDEIRQFFSAVSYLTFTNELCQLWSYWTKFHEFLSTIYTVSQKNDNDVAHYNFIAH